MRAVLAIACMRAVEMFVGGVGDSLYEGVGEVCVGCATDRLYEGGGGVHVWCVGYSNE